MEMMVKYTMGVGQLKKYYYKPFVKLIATIIFATVISLLWFNVDKARMAAVIAGTLTWIGLVHLLPFLIIALRHKRISEHASFVIDTNHTYHYKQRNKELSFRADEIEKVFKIVSPPKYDGRIDMLGFGHFFYWEIILTDGTIIMISCMLLDCEEFFGVRSSRKKQLFVMPPNLMHDG